MTASTGQTSSMFVTGSPSPGRRREHGRPVIGDHGEGRPALTRARPHPTRPLRSQPRPGCVCASTALALGCPRSAETPNPGVIANRLGPGAMESSASSAVRGPRRGAGPGASTGLDPPPAGSSPSQGVGALEPMRPITDGPPPSGSTTLWWRRALTPDQRARGRTDRRPRLQHRATCASSIRADGSPPPFLVRRGARPVHSRATSHSPPGDGPGPSRARPPEATLTPGVSGTARPSGAGLRVAVEGGESRRGLLRDGQAAILWALSDVGGLDGAGRHRARAVVRAARARTPEIAGRSREHWTSASPNRQSHPIGCPSDASQAWPRGALRRTRVGGEPRLGPAAALAGAGWMIVNRRRPGIMQAGLKGSRRYRSRDRRACPGAPEAVQPARRARPPCSTWNTWRPPREGANRQNSGRRAGSPGRRGYWLGQEVACRRRLKEAPSIRWWPSSSRPSRPRSG